MNGVSEQWYECNKDRLGHFEILPLAGTTVRGAFGTKSKIIKKQILLRVNIKDFVDDIVFLVIPNLSRECILGIELLKTANCIINFKENKIILCNNTTNVIDEYDTLDISELEEVDKHHNVNFINAAREITTLDEEQQHQLIKILQDHARVFRDEPGRISGYEHELRVVDETPFFQKSWPIPLAHQAKVDQEIKRMMEFGVIERSNSQYINPLVTVIKKDGSVRLCLDARKLNSVTIPDYEGTAPINEILMHCEGTKFMSSIDLKNSFWQVPLSHKSRDYTGFLYKGRTYRFTVTPFGLKTSSASLARGLDTVLPEEVKKFTLIYVDDCLVISKNIEEHMRHLKLLLQNLYNANITVNFQKSQFFRKEISYLGYQLSTDGITTDSSKISAILNYPRPKNHKQLKGFLGLTNFYNRFTNKYAATTQPLLQLLKKDRNFKWNQEYNQHFENVKKLFINTVVLKHPNPNRPYFLQTDASSYALGGQLYQYDDENNVAVIAFTSRTFKGAEQNYHTTEKELLSIIHCLNKFRLYLLGNKFTIVTDNKALTFLQKCHLTNARMTRWILSMQEYDFDIIHCKGKENIVADMLSRNPEDIDIIEDGHEGLEINDIAIKVSKDCINNIKQLGRLQREDDKINKIIETLSKSNNSRYKDKYKYHKNVLYRNEKGKWKLYVPQLIKGQIITEFHNAYGHGGIQRTIKMFKEYFTTDQLIKTTKEIIRSCDLCQRCKDNNRQCHGETKAIVPSEKGELISADYYGPLMTSSAGVKYILVLVDNFTKFVKLYSLRRATTYTTLKKIKEYVDQYGKPMNMLTDNGTQFTTPKWKEGLAALGIKARLTSIRSPCTNVAERINRQLGNLFRMFMRGTHSGWARHLKLIEHCINESYHDTIGTTPYEAQFNTKPLRNWTKFIDKEVITDEPCITASKIHLRIKEKRQKAADEQNNKTKLTTFGTGDKVLLKTCPISEAVNKIVAKFCDLYEGPYIVRERIGKSTYILVFPENSKKVRGKFNVRLLKKYYQ